MREEQLNILFLPKWYPSKFDEYDGNFIENHAKAVSKSCNIGVIFCHSDALKSRTFNLEKTSPHGFPEYRVFYKKPNTGLKPLNQIISFFRYLKAQQIGYQEFVKDIGEADLSHVHINGRSSLLALHLLSRKNIPFIISEHWSGYTKENGAFKGFFRKLFYRKAARKSERITVVSEYLKRAIESHRIKGNFTVVPNVVDTELFTPSENKVNEIKKIVHISNLSSSPKNMHLIIAALDQVGKKRSDFEFHLMGTGPEEEKMIQNLEESSLKNRYTFYGEVPLKEVAQVLSESDVMLLYSQYETQSVVLIESFACGVPVLVPEVGGIPEYMSAERGMMIPPNSVEKLEEAIYQMLDDKMKYNASKMRLYAVNEFSVDKIEKRFLSIYSEVLANGK